MGLTNLILISGYWESFPSPQQAGCPTIIGSNEKVLKRKQIRPLTQKRRSSFITKGNCRTACKLTGYSTEIISPVF
jgi:hypothetical protein